MVRKPQETHTQAVAEQSYIPEFVRNILQSKSVKTITAIASLLAAEANHLPQAEAQTMQNTQVAADENTESHETKPTITEQKALERAKKQA